MSLSNELTYIWLLDKICFRYRPCYVWGRPSCLLLAHYLVKQQASWDFKGAVKQKTKKDFLNISNKEVVVVFHFAYVRSHREKSNHQLNQDVRMFSFKKPEVFTWPAEEVTMNFSVRWGPLTIGKFLRLLFLLIFFLMWWDLLIFCRVCLWKEAKE